jgi:hypothetical protein
VRRPRCADGCRITPLATGISTRADSRQAIETSEQRGRPLGGAAWTARTVAELGLVHTVRREGRPAKVQEGVKRER